jgi:hypothetical protein
VTSSDWIVSDCFMEILGGGVRTLTSPQTAPKVRGKLKVGGSTDLDEYYRPTKFGREIPKDGEVVLSRISRFSAPC